MLAHTITPSASTIRPRRLQHELLAHELQGGRARPEQQPVEVAHPDRQPEAVETPAEGVREREAQVNEAVQEGDLG